ncbi:VHS domain-containing protein [Acorus calamus]|uniref:VHS domain-containing protein n=1 Tax=Acorus calamus TaxID=4465 RepID=A0AAV9EF90_ACOCL|nr:VHS domain-containing protein [Acorus calamus]
MDSSRRAVEAYWRSKMVDGVTAEEDKVAPVYKLEELCDLLRSSPAGIVKEVSKYVLKRLHHKSPIVKQKALRLIKYAVGKSGVEFKREMQRHSAVMRELVHYRGHPDPLKGDAFNKAVRDTAQEAISAIFAIEDNKPAATEGLNKRIQGFGNISYEPPSEDRKSFLSEVVGIGSASIKQGFSSIAAAHSMRKTDDNGSYRSPNLRRSLTTETSGRDGYGRDEHYGENQGSSSTTINAESGPWDKELSGANVPTNGGSSSSRAGSKTREERLLETIVMSGGIRLQPTRDAIQVFLVEASKLDVMAMAHALESKLQSHMWQVRMKAVCVLEAIMRKKDDIHFSTIVSYFSENRDSIIKCSESPQASLQEKANRVLLLMDGGQNSGVKSIAGQPSSVKANAAPAVVLPDLIDAGNLDDSSEKPNDESSSLTSSSPLVDDLFGDGLVTDTSTSGKTSEDDPFADVLFHTDTDKGNDDIFSGLTVDDKLAGNGSSMPTSSFGSDFLDVFDSNAQQLPQQTSTQKQDVHDLMAGLTMNDLPQTSFPAISEAKVGNIGPQVVNMNPNAFFQAVPMQYSMPQNFMLNPAFASQPMNYAVMGSYIAQQQQVLSTFHNLGHFNAGIGQGTSNNALDGYSSPLPDIFNVPSNSTLSQLTKTSSLKKEETKAFDFISDHLSVARDPKRVS